jgi:hypothetical protein
MTAPRKNRRYLAKHLHNITRQVTHKDHHRTSVFY